MHASFKALCLLICAVATIVLLTTGNVFLRLQPRSGYLRTAALDSYSSLSSAESIAEPMVFSLSYWEQTANALKNLFDLQCWASTINISKVVEPAIFSEPGKVFHFTAQSKVTFSDYFDRFAWNSVNQKYNNSILVSQENFWSNACKNVLFVQLLFKRTSNCQPLTELSKQTWYKELRNSGFNIQSTCINVTSIIPDKVFLKHIATSTGSRMSILFNEWRGINERRSFRLQLKNSRCQNGLSSIISNNLRRKKSHQRLYENPVMYSKKLLHYRDEFLSKTMHGSKFVAVMVRTEKLHLSIISSKHNSSLCTQKITSDLKKAMNYFDTNRTLYFTDFGAHGSSAWTYLINKQMEAYNFSRNLESQLYPYYSSEELNEQLELITRSNDSVLIALLQSAVAASADAMVLVGGASFQIQTLSMYVQEHRGQEKYFFRDSLCNLFAHK